MSFDISCEKSASQKGKNTYWQKCSKLLKCVRRLCEKSGNGMATRAPSELTNLEIFVSFFQDIGSCSIKTPYSSAPLKVGKRDTLGNPWCDQTRLQWVCAESANIISKSAKF